MQTDNSSNINDSSNNNSTSILGNSTIDNDTKQKVIDVMSDLFQVKRYEDQATLTDIRIRFDGVGELNKIEKRQYENITAKWFEQYFEKQRDLSSKAIMSKSDTVYNFDELLVSINVTSQNVTDKRNIITFTQTFTFVEYISVPKNKFSLSRAQDEALFYLMLPYKNNATNAAYGNKLKERIGTFQDIVLPVSVPRLPSFTFDNDDNLLSTSNADDVNQNTDGTTTAVEQQPPKRDRPVSLLIVIVIGGFFIVAVVAFAVYRMNITRPKALKAHSAFIIASHNNPPIELNGTVGLIHELQQGGGEDDVDITTISDGADEDKKVYVGGR
jgi:hypothetical protein